MNLEWIVKFISLSYKFEDSIQILFNEKSILNIKLI
jgi:hypothetical protein